MDFNSTGELSEVKDLPTPTAISGLDNLTEQLSCWRKHLDQYEHPVVLFDGNSWPILLNRPFQELILNNTRMQGTDQTVSSVWKSACSAAADIVTRLIRSQRHGDVAEVFSIGQKCFAALGSLMQWPQTGGGGAVINIAEISSPDTILRSVLSGRLAGDVAGASANTALAEPEEYQRWLAHRAMAREKISVLTRRETEVLAHVAEGHPNKRIATALGVSIKTIEKHRANASTKLGAKSSAEMVRISVVAGQELPSTFEPALN